MNENKLIGALLSPPPPIGSQDNYPMSRPPPPPVLPWPAISQSAVVRVICRVPVTLLTWPDEMWAHRIPVIHNKVYGYPVSSQKEHWGSVVFAGWRRILLVTGRSLKKFLVA